MKIITRGQVPKDIVKEHNCKNCGTVFECKDSEATFRPDPRDGSYFEIDCPVCKNKVTWQYQLPDARH